MKEYLALQYTITNRRFKDAGIEPILAYIILTIGFFGLSIYLFMKTEFAQYIYIFSAFTLVAKLSETQRTEFLKICFGNLQLKKIRIIENLICILPFLAFMVFKLLFLSVAVLLILSVILALVNFQTTYNYTIWTPFSKHPFEFTIGFRNTFYLFFVAYILTLIAISVNNFNLGLFAMLLVFATTLSFYSKPENEYYVWTYRLNANHFLFEKTKTAMLLTSYLVLPIVVILSIYFTQTIGLLLIFFLVGSGFLILIIVTKYSTYPKEINIPEGLLLALCIWFPPVLIFLIPFLFLKAKKSLNYLLK